MRVIDADRLQKQFNEKSTNPYYRVNMHNIKSIISNAPTVEAIPKDEVKKFLEEGIKDVGNNVLTIVREDYIHKVDYENRLKADMVAMLTEIQLECEENTVRWYVGRVDGKSDDVVLMETINDIIQQKINELKENVNK